MASYSQLVLLPVFSSTCFRRSAFIFAPCSGGFVRNGAEHARAEAACNSALFSNSRLFPSTSSARGRPVIIEFFAQGLTDTKPCTNLLKKEVINRSPVGI